MTKTVIIVGSGNAALSAGIAALEKGADVTIYEKADKKLAGGNTPWPCSILSKSGACENNDASNF